MRVWTKDRISTSSLNAKGRNRPGWGSWPQFQAGEWSGNSSLGSPHCPVPRLPRPRCPVSPRVTWHRQGAWHKYVKNKPNHPIKSAGTRVFLYLPDAAGVHFAGNNFPRFWHRKSALRALLLPQELAKPSALGRRRKGTMRTLNPFPAAAGPGAAVRGWGGMCSEPGWPHRRSCLGIVARQRVIKIQLSNETSQAPGKGEGNGRWTCQVRKVWEVIEK